MSCCGLGYLDTVNMATFRLTPDAPSVMLRTQQQLAGLNLLAIWCVGLRTYPRRLGSPAYLSLPCWF